jgi:hypothetical protein
VVFTNPRKTILEFPPGAIAITSFHAEVVDENGTSVPLNEVYNHHWLVFNNIGNLGVCGGYLSYIFGVGAESRNSPVVYPDGYGVVLTGKEKWGANIHLLRTVNTNNTKNCIECAYDPVKKSEQCDESTSGLFACCVDGSFCALNEQGDRTKTKRYALQYTITWTDVITDITPVSVMVLDATNCEIEYNIKASTVQPTHLTTFTWTSPFEGDIVWGMGHQHIGSLNISLLVDGDVVCTSTPQYGTEVGVAGNEKGYLVKVLPCQFNATKGVVHVKSGQNITVASYYDVNPLDDRGLPHGGGSHGGVMSLFYIALARLV